MLTTNVTSYNISVHISVVLILMFGVICKSTYAVCFYFLLHSSPVVFSVFGRSCLRQCLANVPLQCVEISLSTCNYVHECLYFL